MLRDSGRVKREEAEAGREPIATSVDQEEDLAQVGSHSLQQKLLQGWLMALWSCGPYIWGHEAALLQDGLWK